MCVQGDLIRVLSVVWQIMPNANNQPARVAIGSHTTHTAHKIARYDASIASAALVRCSAPLWGLSHLPLRVATTATSSPVATQLTVTHRMRALV